MKALPTFAFRRRRLPGPIGQRTKVFWFFFSKKNILFTRPPWAANTATFLGGSDGVIPWAATGAEAILRDLEHDR
jgi:hypothetical protein